MIKFQVVSVTPLRQNCTILWCDQTLKGVVIDPGGEVQRLLAAVRGLSIEKVLLTHGHFDHAGVAAPLARALNVPIEGPQEGDAFLVEALPEQAEHFGFADPEIESFTPARWLSDGDTVTFGNEVLEVVHAPGHCPGHIIYLHREARFAFVGDVIFPGTVGRTDHAGGDHELLIHTIKTKLLPLGDDIHFLPGHGGISSFGKERVSNPYLA